MQITLVQNELEDALQAYLKNVMTIPATKKFDIELNATRGEKGFTAVVNIVDSKEDPKVPQVVVQAETKAEEPEVKPRPDIIPPKKSFFSNIQ